jgi:hypothetical protein
MSVVYDNACLLCKIEDSSPLLREYLVAHPIFWASSDLRILLKKTLYPGKKKKKKKKKEISIN